MLTQVRLNGDFVEQVKVISEARGKAYKLWGSPKVNADVSYRMMSYVIQNNCVDGALLYNVVTSELVLVQKELLVNLPAPYAPYMDELIKKHFLVPVDSDEYKTVQQLRSIVKKLDKAKRISGYTILPTTHCNARCYYCYENDFDKISMSQQTADDVVAFIEEHCGGEKIQISWFGGEPLVGNKTIDYICKRLNEKNIEFTSGMISNGYLFSDEIVKKAVDLWKLNHIQISIDGTEEVYIKAKAYQNIQDNPYQRVLDNIQRLLDADINVAIRLNVTKENIENLYVLVDELAVRFRGATRLFIYAHAVYGDVGYDLVRNAADPQAEIQEKAMLLEKKIREKGILGTNQSLPHFKVACCMADGDESIIIYPDGRLGKCENSDPVDGVGSIYNGIDQEGCQKHKIAVEYPQCPSCALYPDCINLKVCAETGKCSEQKKQLKIDSYTDAMLGMYKRIKNSNEELDLDSSDEIKCPH